MRGQEREREGRVRGRARLGGGRGYKGSSADSWTLLADPVNQASSGTPSAILFLGKLQRTLQRTRAKVRILSRVEAREGVPREVSGMERIHSK